MKHILLILFVLPFISCSKEGRSLPQLSKCTITISETAYGKASFLLCTQFREPLDTIYIDNKLTLSGTVENYEDEQLLIINANGINKKFTNDIIVNDHAAKNLLVSDLIVDGLRIDIVDDDLRFIRIKNVNSSILFEAYQIERKGNQYTIVITGRDIIQGALYAYSDNIVSMQLNMTLTINIE